MGTKCAPLPIDLLVYFYEVDSHARPSHEKRQKLVRSIIFTFLYKHYILSLIITKLTVDLIYQVEPDIQDNADTTRSTSYLDIHLEVDSESRFGMQLSDKRDDFNIVIVNIL